MFLLSLRSALRCPVWAETEGLVTIFFLFLYINVFIYLFIFGWVGSLLLCTGPLQLQQVGATLHCGAWASHHGGLSHCGARAPDVQASVVVARGLQSAGSVVVAHRLSCSAACGIFPDQGLNPCPLYWQADSQPLHHQGSPRLVTTLHRVGVACVSL